MSSGGTNTVSQNSQPPANFQAALGQTVSQAQGIAATPYQNYSGQLVAPFSPDQNAAIGTVENAQGIADPYINSAAGYINNSTTPLWSGVQQFSPGAVQQYESPYTSQVVGATENQLNNQNEIQQQGVIGNAISSGAWGGDRSAVAQGITAGQQQLNEAPTIAGLENQGYTQALGEFNTQQSSQLGANEANSWLNSQAGYGMANLGNEALSTTLSGANALEGVGSLEQSQAQQELNVPYEQWSAQQAYPFQTAGWLTSLEEGLSSAAGGTATTVSPGASPYSAALGAGTLGLGLYNSGALSGIGSGISGLLGSGAGMSAAMDTASGLGAFAAESAATAGTAGLASGAGEGLGLLAAAKSGGAIPHRAMGGIAGGNVTPLRPHVRTGIAANDDHFPEPIRHRAAGGSTSPMVTVHPGSYAGSPGVPQLQTVPAASGIAAAPTGTANPSVSNYLTGVGASAAPVPSQVPSQLAAPTASSIDTGSLLAALQAADPGLFGSQSNYDGFYAPAGGDWRGGKIPHRDDGGGLDGIDMPDQSAPSGIAAGPSDAPHSNAPWETLVAAGLGMMGGTSPNAMVNIGRGGLEGIEFGQKVKQQEAQQADASAKLGLTKASMAETAKYHSGELDARNKEVSQQGDLARARLSQEASLEHARLGMEGARLAEEERFHNASLEQGHYSWQPGTQQDPNDPSKTIQGAYRFSTRGNEAPQFVPGISLTNKADPSAATFNATGAAANGATGDDYLKTLQPNIGAQVKALAEGRMAFPSGYALKTPYWQNMVSAVSQYDPTFDATDFNKRNRTATDFSAGKSSQGISAINTAMGHLSNLQDRMAALNNGDWQTGNTIANWWKKETGNPAPTTAEGTRDAVASELRKVFSTTGGGGLAELEEWQKNFPLNGSPAQQHEAVQNAVELMDSRLSSLGDRYNSGMGTHRQGIDLLSKDAQAAYQKLTGRQPESGARVGATGQPSQPQAQRDQPARPPVSVMRPPGVPAGSLYSPSTGRWKGPDGTIYPGTP